MFPNFRTKGRRFKCGPWDDPADLPKNRAGPLWHKAGMWGRWMWCLYRDGLPVEQGQHHRAFVHKCVLSTCLQPARDGCHNCWGYRKHKVRIRTEANKSKLLFILSIIKTFLLELSYMLCRRELPMLMGPSVGFAPQGLWCQCILCWETIPNLKWRILKSTFK